MKKLLFLIALVFMMPTISQAQYSLGPKKASETIAFFLKKPLDSLYGIERSAVDSVHIFTYADNATTTVYAVRSTTWPFSDISIDTVKHFTDTMFIFKDAIWDIDGAGGHFELAIDIQMYYDGIATHTYATVKIVADSLNEFGAIKDTVDAILDTLQLWDTRIDSIEGGVSDAAKAAIVDLTWDEPLTGATHNVQNSSGKKVRALQGPTTSGTAQVSGTPTDPGTYIILAAAETAADDFYNGSLVHIVGGTGEGQMRTIEDYTGATDSVFLHVGDNWITNPDATSEYEIGPWAAQEVVHIFDNKITAAVIATDAIDEIADGVWNEDSTGHYTSPQMAFVASQTAAGSGISDADMIAIVDTMMGRATGDTANGGAISKILKDANDALKPATIGRVLDVDVNNRAFVDIRAISADEAAADSLESSLEGYANTQLTNREWLDSLVNAARDVAIGDKVWDTDSTGHYTSPNMAFVASQTGSSAGISDADMAAIADSVWQADTTTHDGVAGSYGATNTSPLRPTVNGRQLDVATTGEGGVDWGNILGTLDAAEIGSGAFTNGKFANGAIGVGKIATNAITNATIASDAIGADEFATNAIDANALATSAVDEIWEYDTSLIGADPAIGAMIKDTTQYQGGAGGGSDTTAIKAMMNNNITSASGGDGWANVYADTTWGIPFDVTPVAGSYNDSATGWGATGSGGTGTFVCTLLTLDTANATEVGGINLQVWNLGQTVEQGRGGTDNNARFIINLDGGPDTFLVVEHSPGWIFPDTQIIISGAQLDTIKGYPISVDDPIDASLVNVTLDISRLGGVTDMLNFCLYAHNELGSFKYAVDTTGGSKLLPPIQESACADTLGRITLNLVKSSEFVDTTQGFYTFKGTYGTTEIFELKRMYITGNINLGDTLAVR